MFFPLPRCVLFELFTDGVCAFDLSEMLSFMRRTEPGCDARLMTILRTHNVGESMCALIVRMLDRMPHCRPSASMVSVLMQCLFII
jgi:hypothetical protein